MVDEMEVEGEDGGQRTDGRWSRLETREGKVGKQGEPWRDVTRAKQAWHVTARDMDWLEAVSLFATSFVWLDKGLEINKVPEY